MRDTSLKSVFIEKNNKAIAKNDQRRGDGDSLRLRLVLADNQSKLIQTC